MARAMANWVFIGIGLSKKSEEADHGIEWDDKNSTQITASFLIAASLTRESLIATLAITRLIELPLIP